MFPRNPISKARFYSLAFTQSTYVRQVILEYSLATAAYQSGKLRHPRPALHEGNGPSHDINDQPVGKTQTVMS